MNCMNVNHPTARKNSMYELWLGVAIRCFSECVGLHELPELAASWSLAGQVFSDWMWWWSPVRLQIHPGADWLTHTITLSLCLSNYFTVLFLKVSVDGCAKKIKNCSLKFIERRAYKVLQFWNQISLELYASGTAEMEALSLTHAWGWMVPSHDSEPLGLDSAPVVYAPPQITTLWWHCFGIDAVWFESQGQRSLDPNGLQQLWVLIQCALSDVNHYMTVRQSYQ